MAENNNPVNLPTELISEKSFYTLGGASASVLISCWAINYVTEGSNLLDYRDYRIIGLLLSEIAAFIIVFKTQKQEGMKWIFALLNGLLIFLNASGMNAMTASNIFNKDQDTSKSSSTMIRAINEHQRQASLFPLPRMTNWWPDEELIAAHEVLIEEKQDLQKTVQELEAKMATVANRNEVEALAKELRASKDSIQALKSRLALKEDETKQQNAANTQNVTAMQKQLQECNREKEELRNRLQYENERCTQLLNECNGNINRLREQNKELEAKMAETRRLLEDCKKSVSSKTNTEAEMNRLRKMYDQCRSQSKTCDDSLVIYRRLYDNCRRQLPKTIDSKIN
jgi:uncharacterized protein YukE